MTSPDFTREPSKKEAVFIVLLTVAIQAFLAIRTVGWRARAAGAFDNLDNSSYLAIAHFLNLWIPRTSLEDQHFWGFPYFILAVSKIFHLRDVDAAILLSIAASIGACLLLHELYGGRVAIAFGMVSSTWILLAGFGGCEPLFICLIFASFLAARRELWFLAALLASVSVTVRPLGIFALSSLLLWALWRRHWAATAQTIVPAALVVCAYLIPVYLLTGDPFFQVRLYGGDWQLHDFPLAHRGLLTLPGLRLAQGFYYLHDYWRSSNASLRKLAWIGAAFGGAALFWNPRRWPDLPPVERMFACTYAAFLLCYNFDYVALYVERFLLPVLPCVLFLLREWIPVNRLILWPFVALSIVFNSVLLFHRF